MGIIRTLLGVRESLQEVGDNAADTAVGVGKAVGRYVCAIYNDYPDFLTGAPIDAVGYVSSFRRSLLENLCGPSNAPPPPTAQFPGGQCVCSRYTGQAVVSFQFYESGQLKTTTVTFGLDLWGPISEFSLEPGSSGGVNLVCVCGGFGNQLCVQPPTLKNCGFIGGGLNHKVVSVSLAPLSGYPDNCGSNPAPPPPSPSESDFNQTFILNVGPNNVSVPFNFTKVSVNPSFPMNLDVRLKFDTSFENNPDNDIILNFGPEGVTGPDQPSLPPSKQPVVTVDIPVHLDVDASTNINNYDEDVDDEDDPKDKEDIVRLGFVEVVLTVVPKNVASQWGGPNGAPDVLYAGWFEFKRKSYAFPRQPIHFLKSVFKAPLGADGYAYTVYEGFQAYAVTYTYKEE